MRRPSPNKYFFVFHCLLDEGALKHVLRGFAFRLRAQKVAGLLRGRLRRLDGELRQDRADALVEAVVLDPPPSPSPSPTT